MSEVTKEDLNVVHNKIGEVHKRIDEMVTCNTKIQVSVAKIQTKLETLVIPATPDRPCSNFKEHVEEHKKIRSIWENSLIKVSIDLAKLAIVAGATYLFTRKNQ